MLHGFSKLKILSLKNDQNLPDERDWEHIVYFATKEFDHLNGSVS